MRCSGAAADRLRQRPSAVAVMSQILKTLVTSFARLGWRLPTLVATLVGLLAGCAGFDAQQRKWIFQAATVPVSLDASGGSEPTVADMEDVWIEHASPLSGRPIRLHALWHAHDDDDAPVLLYLHGARRDVEASVFRIRQMSALGFSVLAIDYRGFGRSTDELPSESTVVRGRSRRLALARGTCRRPRPLRVRSLARRRDRGPAGERGDRCEGPDRRRHLHVDPRRLRQHALGWLPLGPLITQRFDSARKIERVQAPVLVVHGCATR